MKFLQVIISLCLLHLVPLLVVESSSYLNDTSTSNITRGSSLFSNDSASSYWLSPSGNFAFGFYRLPCKPSSSYCTDRYIVGISLVKSAQNTLVWSANRDHIPLHKPSSILFTDDGKLVLRKLPENQDEPLIPGIQEPVSHAKMHDDGNFVLYGWESQIVWQSFDHPTDTILGGQKLKDGVDLVSSASLFNRGSGKYELSIRQRDGLVATYYKPTYEQVKLISGGFGDSINSPVTLNLDTTGKLYLVDSDDLVLGYLYPTKNQQLQENDDVNYIYRATLEPRGDFVLYKEKIDGADESPASNAVLRRWSSAEKFYENWLFISTMTNVVSYIIVLLVFLLGFLCGCMICCCVKRRRRQLPQSSQPGRGGLE